MRHYEPLARKFRPQTFHDVFEQATIIHILKNAITHQRVSQAYLFCGSKGTGKTTLARIFAKALNCKELRHDGEPCNNCQSCKEITLGQSLDVLEIDGASNRGIDDIRQLNETAYYLPSSSPYKIYIIDEVHMLTKEAFNALLKTLEEPPSHVKFFFATTEPHKVLPTILSRCQRFDLSRISRENIAKKLSIITEKLGIKADEAALLSVAKLSDGSMRDAESIMDQILCYGKPHITLQDVEDFLGLASHDYYFKLTAAIADYKLDYAYTLTEELYTSGKDLTYFIEGLVEHFQTLLKVKLGLIQAKSFSQDELEAYKQAATLLSQDKCLYILDELMKHIQAFLHTSFKKIHLEMLLLTLIRSSRRLPLDALMYTLENLKKSTSLAHEIPPSQLPSASLTPKETPLETPPLTNQVEPILDITLAESLPKQPIAQDIKEYSQPKIEPQESNKESLDLHRYETLLRFTSVELGGTLKKDLKT